MSTYKQLAEKQKESIALLAEAIGLIKHLVTPQINTKLNIIADKLEIVTSEIKQIEEAIEKEEKPKRIRKEASIKICAACGSFAHGNPGHDIT